MFYIFNHALWFFLPGLLFLYLVAASRITFLTVFAVSYSLMILTLLPLIYFDMPIAWFSRLIYAELGLLVLASGINVIWHVRRHPDFATHFLQRARRKMASTSVVLLLVAIFALYWLYAGPYTEIPADFWAHLNRVQYTAWRIEEGRFSFTPSLLRLITQQDYHWYFIAAWLCRQSGTAIESAFPHVMLANSVIFLLGIYSFGLLVFRKFRCSQLIKTIMAAVSALFCVAHLGVMVFSYVRYYVLAPAILNYVLFLATMAVWLAFLDGKRRAVWRLAFLPILMLVMVVIHTQEAVFAAVMISATSLASATCIWLTRRTWRNRAFVKSIISFCLFTACWVGTFFWLRAIKPSIILEAYRHYLVPVTGWLPFWKNGMVLNPIMAMEVITFWGLLVYGLFLVNIRKFIRSPLIVGGMMVPLITFFNPALVDIVLRSRPIYVSVLYRFGFIVPLAYVAGALAVQTIKNLMRPQEENHASLYFWQLARMGVLIALVLLLFPLDLSIARQSRWVTIRKTPRENSRELWSDLCSFLQTIPRKHISTQNAVTGYVIGGLTHHFVDVDKFCAIQNRLCVDDLETPVNLALRNLDPQLQWLVVINRRDGGTSAVGALSLHWPTEVLKVSNDYPNILVEYIENRPELFVKIWEQDRISVYEISRTGFETALPAIPQLTSAKAVLLEGPGIRLDWTPVTPEDFVAYHIQCSEDSIAWRDINTTREYCYPWINHQGLQTDVHGKWSWCLPSGKTYYYRVRAIYHSGPGEWSNTMQATVQSYTEE